MRVRRLRLSAAIAGGAALAASSLLIHPGPAAALSGSPTFTNFAAPGSLPNVNNAGEPTLGVNGKTGAMMYQAYASTYKVTVNAAGVPSWTNVTPLQHVFNIDPILATDRTTGRTFAGGLAGECSALNYSDNDGASWTPMGNACAGVLDHESIGSGPWKGAAPLGSTYSRAVYYCAQNGNDACATSSNGGLTFGAPVLVSGACGSLHGHVKVAPDGTAYLPNAHCGGKAGGAITTNNGSTWTSYTIPGSSEPANGFDPSVAITPDGTLYESWQGADNHSYVAKSTTRGATWSTPVDVGAGLGVLTSTFQAVVAGDNGRVAVAYLGSTTGGNPFDSKWNGVWDLYVSYSYDAGATWTTVKATTDPVQRGWMCASGTTCNSGRNLLDFMDANVTTDGRVVVGYADGCIGTCAGSSGTKAQSVDAYSTIAYQSAGKGLFAAFDTP
ncbi:MAG TPA: sialidase family protein [Mycobacteriales bacterium]|nr:sialidase family protein [Mycobacteriales bacterium]